MEEMSLWGICGVQMLHGLIFFEKLFVKIGKEGFWIPRPIEGKIGGLGYEH
jgi:hypothetical protein